MTSEEQIIHDTVAFASASTYYVFKGQGLRVSVNTDIDKVRFINSSAGSLWPDVIVWLPDQNSKVLVIEEVEVESTANESSLAKWKQYSQIQAGFHLIVPLLSAITVNQLLSQNGLNQIKLQTWSADMTGRISFG